MYQKTSDRYPSVEAGFSVFWVLFWIVFLSIGPVLYLLWNLYSEEYFEHYSPTIKVTSNPTGIGSGVEPLTVALEDEGAGLDEVVVRLRRRNKTVELYRESLSGFSVTKQFPIGTEEQALAEGEGQLEVRVFDKSFFSNGARVTLPLLIDQSTPTIELLSKQHNGAQGGAQLVLYRAKDNHLQRHGIRYNGKEYRGIPLRLFDRDVKSSDLFGVLMAFEVGEKPEVGPRLFAVDAAGNEIVKKFFYRLRNRRYQEVGRSWKRAALHKAAGEKLPLDTVWARRNESTELLKQKVVGAPAEACSLGVFKKFPGTIKTSFGARLAMNGGQARSTGYEINVGPEGTVIRSALSGTVAYAGDWPALGNVVVVTHGCDLYTLYAQLNEVTVETGQKIEEQYILGKVGATGFTDRRGLWFEVWASGTPIDAREWWDGRWYYSHIAEKIKELKRDLGLELDEW